ncbi:hypothetical protein [Demequina gelatinilytica]|uniref:hypothetical protein n=1 Tax=Demequina gelatinilytica TaxID=1638980 RepID=UPI000783AB4D|nr:hypothetical protein [Demequina gelatinilytica]
MTGTRFRWGWAGAALGALAVGGLTLVRLSTVACASVAADDAGSLGGMCAPGVVDRVGLALVVVLTLGAVAYALRRAFRRPA